MSVMAHEPLCLDSLQDRLFFFDDFEGDQLKDEWREAGAGSAAVVDLQMGGVIRFTTGATTNNFYSIDWGSIRSLHVSKRVSMEIRLKANQATWIGIDLRLVFDANNQIKLYIWEAAGGATTWQIYSADGGATTLFDAGVALDTDYHIFRIECHTHGANHVHFYIDGVETANSPITTNIPDDAGDYLQPFIGVWTTEDATKSMDVDYCYVRQDR